MGGRSATVGAGYTGQVGSDTPPTGWRVMFDWDGSIQYGTVLGPQNSGQTRVQMDGYGTVIVGNKMFKAMWPASIGAAPVIGVEAVELDPIGGRPTGSGTSWVGSPPVPSSKPTTGTPRGGSGASWISDPPVPGRKPGDLLAELGLNTTTQYGATQAGFPWWLALLAVGGAVVLARA